MQLVRVRSRARARADTHSPSPPEDMRIYEKETSALGFFWVGLYGWVNVGNMLILNK